MFDWKIDDFEIPTSSAFTKENTDASNEAPAKTEPAKLNEDVQQRIQANKMEAIRRKNMREQRLLLNGNGAGPSQVQPKDTEKYLKDRIRERKIKILNKEREADVIANAIRLLKKDQAIDESLLAIVDKLCQFN